MSGVHPKNSPVSDDWFNDLSFSCEPIKKTAISIDDLFKEPNADLKSLPIKKVTVNSGTSKVGQASASFFSSPADDLFTFVNKTKTVANVLKAKEKPLASTLSFLEEDEDIDFSSILPSQREAGLDLFSTKDSSSLFSSTLFKASSIVERSEKEILAEVQEIEARILELYTEKNGQLFCEVTQESLGVSFQELSEDLRNMVKSEKKWKLWRTKEGSNVFPRFITQKLGAGHFAKAYLVIDLDQPFVFVFKKGIAQKWKTDLSGKIVKMEVHKITASQEKANREVLNEFEVLSAIHKHGPVPGVQYKPYSYTSSLAVGKKEKTGFSGIRYDETLYDHLKKGNSSIEKKYAILHQLAEGLHHLHSAEIGVVHGDIKPENIFVKSDKIFHLADFGGALLCEDPNFINKAKDSSYTPSFAPFTDIAKEAEYADRGEKESLIDLQKKRDIFALGMVFYEVLNEKLPFELYPSSGHPNLSTLHFLSESALIPSDVCSLIHRMLAERPEERPTAEEVSLVVKTFCNISTEKGF